MNTFYTVAALCCVAIALVLGVQFIRHQTNKYYWWTCAVLAVGFLFAGLMVMSS